MENKAVSNAILHDNQISKQVRLNREMLRPIVETILLCGRQNISLGGHRDDAKYVNELKNNPGNLHAILKYLAKNLANAPKSGTYQSKRIQNELIAICENMLTERIIGKILFCFS